MANFTVTYKGWLINYCTFSILQPECKYNPEYSCKKNESLVHAIMFATLKAGTANIIKAKKIVPIASNKNQAQFKSP
jgi:hypothetical protein